MTMNTVGMFGIFFRKGNCLFKITVEHYLKITLYTSQGSVAAIYSGSNL